MEQFCLPSSALAWLQAISDEVPGKYSAQIRAILQQAVPIDTVRPAGNGETRKSDEANS